MSNGNQYEIIVKIPNKQDVVDLQNSKLNICLLKNVKQDGHKASLGNVVFGDIPFDSVAPKNRFTWTEEYKVGMTNSFQHGVQVDVSTHEYELSGNEKIVFNKAGSGDTDDSLGKHDPTKPFVVRNEWQHNSRAVVFSKMSKIGENPDWNPFFVSKGLPIKTTVSLTPVVACGILLRGDMSTGDMIALAESDVFPIKFTELGTTKVVITYVAGLWKLEQ